MLTAGVVLHCSREMKTRVAYICEITRQSSQVGIEEAFCCTVRIYMTSSLPTRNDDILILSDSTSCKLYVV
jgi:hypothetical protein